MKTDACKASRIHYGKMKGIATIAVFFVCFASCAQTSSKGIFRVNMSTGVNLGYFFDDRPVRVSYTELYHAKPNEPLKKSPLFTSTFVQSTALSVYHLPTGLGIGLSLNCFLHSREQEGPFSRDGYIREDHINFSVNLLYRWPITDKLALRPQIGIGYRRSYNVYEFEFTNFNDPIERVLSRDIASNIGLKLTYDLPLQFYLGVGAYVFNTVYREKINYNPPTALNISATLGYSLFSNLGFENND